MRQLSSLMKYSISVLDGSHTREFTCQTHLTLHLTVLYTMPYLYINSVDFKIF